MLAAQPRLDSVGIFFLAECLEGSDLPAPDQADSVAARGVGDVGEQVTLEHVRGRQRKPAVVHGLEDGVGVGVGECGDLNQMHVLDHPVSEERQHYPRELLREDLLYVLVAMQDVDDGLGLAVLVEDRSGEERLHAGAAFLNVKVK